jgi:hypothetical protein
MKNNFSLIFCSYLISISVFAHPLDDVFSKSQASKSRTETSVSGSVHSDVDNAYGTLRTKVDAGDIRSKEFNEYVRSKEAQKQTNAEPVAKKAAATLKKFSCNVYCTNGKTTRYKGTANSLKDMANWVGDHAHEICSENKNEFASRKSFSQNQCSEE